MTETVEEDLPMRKRLSGTALRVATVVPLIPLILFMMFWDPADLPWWRWVWHVFILAAIAVGGYEVMAMKVPSSRSLCLWGSISSVAFASSLIFLDSVEQVYGVVLLLILATMLLALLREDPLHNASVHIGWSLATPVYVGGTLATVDLVRDFPPTGAWVLLAFALAWGSDTSAYFFGRKFGKTKLAPRISPKKTLEGAGAGLAGSVFCALVISFFVPALPAVDAIALGVIGGVAGQGGDLFESVLKRSSGVKDSGGILPGHGGLLDRVDALVFTAPATWAYGTFIAGFGG
ncbi:MAG: phosphatidate cytidylyltransferase [Myxococcales bacterium]|nr:phosphatidate cytidylyltransferase [Myxococcales bacterium]